MKRVAFIGIVLVVALALFAGQAAAASQAKVTYGVNFRSQPSVKSDVYRMLKKGETITVLEQVNKYWLKVRDKNGKVGYISSDSKYIEYIGSGSPGSSGSAPAGTAGSAIVATALSYQGAFTYKFGAEPWNTNYKYSDCSAFVQLVFNKIHGYNLPRTSLKQSQQGTSVAKANLKPGDLVFFDTNDDGVINHVGIYIGNGEFIHSSPSNKVGINSLVKGYWKNKYITARRVL